MPSSSVCLNTVNPSIPAAADHDVVLVFVYLAPFHGLHKGQSAVSCNQKSRYRTRAYHLISLQLVHRLSQPHKFTTVDPMFQTPLEPLPVLKLRR